MWVPTAMCVLLLNKGLGDQAAAKGFAADPAAVPLHVQADRLPRK